MADKNEDVIVDVEQAYTKTEQYIQDNQKTLSLIVGAIVVALGAYFSYQYLYIAPKEVEAEGLIWNAQRYLELDSFNLAINGDAINPGFEEIADDYGMTKAGNMANYYSGVCHLNLGNFDIAIEYLKAFKPVDDMVTPMATGLIGDANMELGNTDAALDYYLEAAGMADNSFTAPYWLSKAGMAYESNNNFAQALETYEKIKNQFPESPQAREIEKFIARAKSRS